MRGPRVVGCFVFAAFAARVAGNRGALTAAWASLHLRRSGAQEEKFLRPCAAQRVAAQARARARMRAWLCVCVFVCLVFVFLFWCVCVCVVTCVRAL